jgi:flagellar biosynthesis/type III secretory pathway M-ring protein FliF/YscJ
VLAESRQKAEQWMAKQGTKPRSLVGGVAIVLIWVLVAVVLSLWVTTALGH